jgi:hypothetical protein
MGNQVSQRAYTLPCYQIFFFPHQCCSWKAAASDEKKRMWAIIEETGIFFGAYRHGLILWYTDMMRSGELYIFLVTT